MEPLAANIVAESERDSFKKLKGEFLRIAAPLLGISYDALKQRQRTYRYQKIMVISGAVMAGAIAFSVYAYRQTAIISRQAQEISEEYRQNLISQSKYYVKEAKELKESNNSIQAVEKLLLALPDEKIDRPVVSDAVFELADILNLYKSKYDVENTVTPVGYLEFGKGMENTFFMDSSGKYLFTSDRYTIGVRDAETFELVREIKVQDEGYIQDFENNFFVIDQNRILYCDGSNQLYCVDYLTGKVVWSDTETLGKAAKSVSLSLSEDQKVLAAVIYGQVYTFDAETGKKLAEEIGYPVMIKASSGGGGKGMRVAANEDEFEFQFNMAQRESANAFGDDTMYIERFVENPRHVEIQIMADSHGNVVALGERDCSVQRNHQKLIEESPSPAIDEETRRKMNEYAVLAAKTVGYTNAGTIEFIVDPKGNFYFMEMNTRIQVEHGVTEMVTGTDLIIEQIRVAMGEELSFKQEDIRIKGHAIECRINAEIPEKNFMPSPGVVQHMHLPAGNGVRVDTALYTGYKIPSEYDSMIAKVIVHAPDREAALQKMRSALDEMVVMGVETNLDFQYQLMNNREFCEGKADTGFIERLLKLD